MIKYFAVAAVLVAGPAFAQAAPANNHAAHADHGSHADHAAKAPAQAKLSLDTPIEALMAHPKAKAAVEASIPGVEGHPAYGQFKAMSLKEVQPYSGGMITDEMLTKIEAALGAIEG